MFDLLVPPEESPGACDTDELVGLLAAHARVEAMAAQRKVAVAAELERRRRAPEEAAGYVSSQTGDFVRAEVAVALTVSAGMAACLLDIGSTLDLRLPLTKQAFSRGELDFARVRIIVARTAYLSDALAAELEPKILDRALSPGREVSSTRLGAVIDRLVITADPDGVTRRRQRAEQDRDVRVRPDADGMCSLWGMLRGVDGRILDERLRDMAVAVCGSDPRTLAQRRADALTALALGVDHLVCTCGGASCPCRPEAAPRPRVLVQVTIDAATLAGAADLPGVLSGFGVIDPDLVRRLAADAHWQQLLTTAGAVAGVGPVQNGGTVPDASGAAWRYEPSPKLARLVRARDGHCRFPGCAVPAARCDLDHVVPFNRDNPRAGGPTTATNLQCLCRWHHRIKTHGDWSVRFLPGAVIGWTSPTGTQHETVPHGGADVSHHDPDIDAHIPPPPPPDETEDPLGWADHLPEPVNDDDLRRMIDDDPVSTAELEALFDQGRFAHPPPNPELPAIVHVVRCDCPPF